MVLKGPLNDICIMNDFAQPAFRGENQRHTFVAIDACLHVCDAIDACDVIDTCDAIDACMYVMRSMLAM